MYNFYSAVFTLFNLYSVWYHNFHFVAKLAVVECEKCPLFHTELLDRYECTILYSK